MDSVLRNYFAGGGFAKPRLRFLKFGGIEILRPAGECGRNAGRGFLDFGRGGLKHMHNILRLASFLIWFVL